MSSVLSFWEPASRNTEIVFPIEEDRVTRVRFVAVLGCLLVALASGCGKPKPPQTQIDQFLESCKKNDTKSATTLLDHFSSRELVNAHANASFRDLLVGIEDEGVKDIWRGWTALHAAANNGNAVLAKSLIEAGADVNSRSKIQMTPLHWAIGHAEVARVLIENGADVNAQNKAGSTPLILAASEGLIPSVKLLIGKGADVKISNHHGATALHAAAMQPDGLAWATDLKATVELLIENGADVNATDEDGETPLSLTLMMGNEAIAKILRDHGAKK